MIVKGDREYFRQFAREEDFDKIIPFENVVDFLEHIKKEYDGKKAIGKDDGSIATFNDVYNDAQKVANYLAAKGIKKHTNVGIIAGNNYTFAVLSLGVMAYGCVATLIPNHLDSKTLFGCSMKYAMTAFLYEDKFEAQMADAIAMSKILIDKASNVLATSAEKDCFERNLSKDDSACIIMTGGTTGRSKGAVLSHDALMAGVENGCYGVDIVFDQVYYCILPLTHVFGYIRNLLCSLYTGSLIYFTKDKKEMFKEMAVVQPTVIVVVPALAELFLNLIKAYGPGIIGGKVKILIAGAALVSPFLLREYDEIGIKLRHGYGLTELANLVSGNTVGAKKAESVGRLYPNQEAKIVNGELWLKGRNLMKEYFNEPEENKTAFEDGWFKTGDLARFDEDGDLYIIGRSKDVIVRANGENVSPAYIESKINEIELVQDSLVTEDRNEYGAEILKVEVVLRQRVVAASGIAPDKIHDYLWNEIEKINAGLQDYERVSKLVIRDKDFDRSPAMKIIRPKKVF